MIEIPYPSFTKFDGIETMFGEMSEILLQGSRISAEKIQTTGYKFQFRSLEGALQQLTY